MKGNVNTNEMSFIPTILTNLIKVAMPTVGSVVRKFVCLYFSESKANNFNP